MKEKNTEMGSGIFFMNEPFLALYIWKSLHLLSYFVCVSVYVCVRETEGGKERKKVGAQTEERKRKKGRKRERRGWEEVRTGHAKSNLVSICLSTQVPAPISMYLSKVSFHSPTSTQCAELCASCLQVNSLLSLHNNTFKAATQVRHRQIDK